MKRLKEYLENSNQSVTDANEKTYMQMNRSDTMPVILPLTIWNGKSLNSC